MAALLGVACLAALGDDAPALVSVDVQGVSVYSRARVLRITGVEPGRPLLRPADDAAAALEARYRDDGYLAARVVAELAPSGTALTLRVDEGALLEVEIPVLEGGARQRALESLALPAGPPIQELDVEAALFRLERASRGGLVRGDPAYEVRPAPGGARLVLNLRRRRLLPRLRLDRVGTQTIYDRVSGLVPRLGAELAVTDDRSYDPTIVYGHAAYGIEAEKVRFDAGIWRALLGGRLLGGYEFHDFTDTDDDFRSRGIAEPPGSPLSFRRYEDHFARRGHEGYLLVHLGSRWRAGLTFRADRYESLAAVTGSPEDPPVPNPAVDEGAMRSFAASLQWSSRPGTLGGTREDQRAALLRSLYVRPLPEPQPFSLNATFEWASRDLGGDFSFRRTILEVLSHHSVTRPGTLSTRVLLGAASRDVPVQKRFFLGGLGTLRGYEEKEFDGEGFVLVNVEWALVTRRLVPALIPLADLGATWRGARTTDGIRADVGLGLRWPPTAPFFVRVDGAVAITRGGSGLRVTGLVQVPF